MSILNFDDPEWPDCWMPTKERVRHLSDEVVEPPKGIVAYLLCGVVFLVGHERSTAVIYDCPHCADVWRERNKPPASRFAPVPQTVRVPPGRRLRGPAVHPPPLPAGPRLPKVAPT